MSGDPDDDEQDVYETVSIQRRRSDLRRNSTALTRIRGRAVFGIVLMGSVGKVVNNRVRHRAFTGEYFGLLNALSERAAGQEYVALEDTEFLAADVERFKALLDDFPALQHKVWLNIGVNMVDGLLASLFPTAELPPFERLALAKRGRLILVEQPEPISIPAFSSGFLLRGRSIDDPSVRSRISTRMASRFVNPNLSAKAGHIIPTEMAITYEPGSYLFVLDDVPLLEARAFVLTHIPFVDSMLLQLNMGVTSFVRSLFKGQDRINTLFRVTGDLLPVFPAFAAMLELAQKHFQACSPVAREAILSDVRGAAIAGAGSPDFGVTPPAAVGRAFDLSDTASLSRAATSAPLAHVDSSTSPSRRANTFYTTEDRYEGAADATQPVAQQSMRVGDPVLEPAKRERQVRRALQSADLEGVEMLESPGDDDTSQGATTNEPVDDPEEASPEAIIESLGAIEREVRDMHSFIRKVLLQQYEAQVRVRALVQRIARFFRAFSRVPTAQDPSPRPLWVRVVCSVFDDVPELHSVRQAESAMQLLSSKLGVSKPDCAGGCSRCDSPVLTALRPDKAAPPLGRKYATLDRVAHRLPHAFSSVAFSFQTTAVRVPRLMVCDEDNEGDFADLADGGNTPSVLEGRQPQRGGSFNNLSRQGSLRGSFAGSDGSPQPFGSPSPAADPLNLTQRTQQQRDDQLLAAVNDFDE